MRNNHGSSGRTFDTHATATGVDIFCFHLSHYFEKNISLQGFCDSSP